MHVDRRTDGQPAVGIHMTLAIGFCFNKKRSVNKEKIKRNYQNYISVLFTVGTCFDSKGVIFRLMPYETLKKEIHCVHIF
jgi:hypothetical protein